MSKVGLQHAWETSPQEPGGMGISSRRECVWSEMVWTQKAVSNTLNRLL